MAQWWPSNEANTNIEVQEEESEPERKKERNHRLEGLIQMKFSDEFSDEGIGRTKLTWVVFFFI